MAAADRRTARARYPGTSGGKTNVHSLSTSRTSRPQTLPPLDLLLKEMFVVSRSRPFLVVPACCALLAAIPAGASARPADATASAAKPRITMSGSTSVYPLAVQLGKGYLKKHPNSVAFRISQGGSDIGIDDAARGRVQIGNSSRDLLDGDPGGLQFTKIAKDGVCVVTHPDNPIAGLNQEQVQDIFSGSVRRWEDVEGAQVEGPIDLYVRTQASGTQDAFQNIFMGPDLRVTPSAEQKASNGLVQASVSSDEAGIGYVDFRFTEGIHAVPYKGVACSLRNAKSGQYPGIRNFWFVTRGAPKSATKRFIKYSRSKAAQRDIVARKWVPIR
jgi:phosphate transport system substrate-binding protein